MLSIITGFVAGSGHVLSGPDHVAAIAPLAVDGEKRAWLTGFRWGLGHSVGVLVVGTLSLFLREILPLEVLSSWAERGVGIALIGVGLWGVRRALTCHVHTHEHVHDGRRHAHIHLHGSQTAHVPHSADSGAGAEGQTREMEPAHAHAHAAFAMGTLHGLAGSSQLLSVTAALAFPTWAGACAYLAAYALGTVLTMTLFSSAMGWASTRFDLQHGGQSHRYLMGGCSLAAVGLGVVWLTA